MSLGRVNSIRPFRSRATSSVETLRVAFFPGGPSGRGSCGVRPSFKFFSCGRGPGLVEFRAWRGVCAFSIPVRSIT